MVSVASIVLAVLAAVAFARDWPIVAGLLVHASSVVDGVDGDLARLQGTSSTFGAIFDATLDRFADGFILGGMALWSYQHTDLPLPLALGVGAIGLALLVSYSRARVEASAPGVDEARAGIATRDVRLFVAALASVVGLAYWALLAIATLSLGTLGYRMVRLYDQLRNAS